MNKLAVSGLLAVCAATRVFATAFGPETDMATLNDYFYYVTNPGEGRAVHYPNAGGWYSLSEDRVWSSLCLSPTYLSADTTPVCFDLGGHTLTVTGCDTDYHPFGVTAAGVTCILSNGTISAVHDETTYPKTNGKYATVVSVQKGSTLIIEKDATLVHDDGTAALSLSGNNNKVIVRDGGTLNTKFARGGVNNRWIFEKGAKWPAISNYISNGSFPNSIWYESGDTSNLFEICSSEFLTRYGITTFNVAAHEKAGSYHCGMVLRSPDVDFSMVGLTVGNEAAPTLFEVRDGAKLTLSGELWIVSNTNAAGSVMNIDGPGTVVKQTGQWGGRIGVNGYGTTFDPEFKGCTNGLLRISNGACFDLSQNSANYNVGYGRNCNYNAMEVLSGSCVTGGTFVVGHGNNCGCTLRIDGAGSVVNMSSVTVGRGDGEGGGGHQVIVSNGGQLILRTSGIYMGEASTNCLLDIDGGTVQLLSGEVAIGGTDGLGGSYAGNCLNVKNGSLSASGQFLFRSKDARVVVSNGTLTAAQFHFPQSGYPDATGVELTLAGRSAHLVATRWGIQVRNNTKVRFIVPKNGYENAPLDTSAAEYVGLFDNSTVEIDATAFLESDREVTETLLVSSRNNIQGQAMFSAATITPNDGRVRLKWSADKTKLFLRRSQGLVLVVR